MKPCAAACYVVFLKGWTALIGYQSHIWCRLTITRWRNWRPMFPEVCGFPALGRGKIETGHHLDHCCRTRHESAAEAAVFGGMQMCWIISSASTPPASVVIALPKDHWLFQLGKNEMRHLFIKKSVQYVRTGLIPVSSPEVTGLRTTSCFW